MESRLNKLLTSATCACETDVQVETGDETASGADGVTNVSSIVWHLERSNEAASAAHASLSRTPIAATEIKERLCFTACLNKGYILGAKGLIKSIRKFYCPEEADIIVFVDEDFEDFPVFCAENSVELHYFSEIWTWLKPLVYDNPRYANDTSHFYHPRFRPVPGLAATSSCFPVGFDRLRHLHPLNVKAYCTGYSLCIRNYRRVAHIDCDAFLLARIDEMFERHGEPDTVIGFEDDEDDLPKLETLFGFPKPPTFHRSHYGFNAGIVFYVNGPGVKALMHDFMFYIESCYHYTHAGTYNDADQGLLRVLVAKHAILGHIRFFREDNVNWNPTWKRAEHLVFDTATQVWINRRNDRKQFLWHDPTGGGVWGRVWTGRYSSPSVNSAWQWAGGTYESWRTIPGRLLPEQCEALADELLDFSRSRRKNKLTGLEIGTMHGQTAVSLCTLLKASGVDIHIDTCDTFSPASKKGTLSPNLDGTLNQISRFHLGESVIVHDVREQENLAERFTGWHFDFVFISGAASYGQMVADCVMAIRLVTKRSLILGIGYDQAAVRNAINLVFGLAFVRSVGNLWVVDRR